MAALFVFLIAQFCTATFVLSQNTLGEAAICFKERTNFCWRKCKEKLPENNTSEVFTECMAKLSADFDEKLQQSCLWKETSNTTKYCIAADLELEATDESDNVYAEAAPFRSCFLACERKQRKKCIETSGICTANATDTSRQSAFHGPDKAKQYYISSKFQITDTNSLFDSVQWQIGRHCIINCNEEKVDNACQNNCPTTKKCSMPLSGVTSMTQNVTCVKSSEDTPTKPKPQSLMPPTGNNSSINTENIRSGSMSLIWNISPLLLLLHLFLFQIVFSLF